MNKNDELCEVIRKDIQETVLSERGEKKNQRTKQCVPFCEKEGKHLLKLSLKDIQNVINSNHSEGKGGSWVDAVQEGKNSAYLFIIFLFFSHLSLLFSLFTFTF